MLDSLPCADGAGVVDVGFGNSAHRFTVSFANFENAAFPISITFCELSPLLRRVIFVRMPSLRLRFDCNGIGLGTVDRAPGRNGNVGPIAIQGDAPTPLPGALLLFAVSDNRLDGAYRPSAALGRTQLRTVNAHCSPGAKKPPLGPV